AHEPVFAGDLALVLAKRAARQQHRQQIEIACTGRGMVVVDPPRTLRDKTALADFERFGPGRVADPAEPATRAVVEGFHVSFWRGHAGAFYPNGRDESCTPVRRASEGERLLGSARQGTNGVSTTAFPRWRVGPVCA